MPRYEAPLSVVLKGALAGLAGTVASMAFTEAMRAWRARRPGEGDRPSTAPEGQSPGEAQPSPQRGQGPGPSYALAERLIRGVLETEATPRRVAQVAGAIRLSYGALWGVDYGILAGTVRLPLIMGGPMLGTMVWAFGPFWLLPRLKLSPPVPELPRSMVATSVAGHLIYGLVTAAAFNLMHRRGARIKEIELEIEFEGEEEEGGEG